MSQTPYEIFEEIKALLSFDDQDVSNLVELAGILGPEVPDITARFYEVLLRNPGTAAFLEGRDIDTLRKTHIAWFEDVLKGEYGRAFFDRQFKIGLVHVQIALPPYYVEGIMSFIRFESIQAINRKVGDSGRAAALASSLTKILDLNLAVINQSYHEIRLNRLTEVTGMGRPLLENLILLG